MDGVLDVEVEPVTPDRWEDLAALFERLGPRGGRTAPGYCWCTVWRAPMATPPENREVLRECTAAGPPPGLLAYHDGHPVGWISVAPRTAFARLAFSHSFRGVEPDAGIHVISCFFVAREKQHQGIASQLLDAAIDRAPQLGASAVEASPADPPDFTGRVEQFLARGFQPLRRVGNRTIVRLDLD